MNDASHHSQRPLEAILDIELLEKPAMGCVRARAKLENIGVYFDHERATTLHESLFTDCIKSFYVLAAPQLAPQVIDARLLTDGEETSVSNLISAMDVELAAWQRYGLVSSQVHPLIDFSETLTKLEQAILDDENLDVGLRRRMELQLNSSR